MKIQGKNELRDLLAAEYALGTLRGGARRRFESWMRDDAALRALVAKWQQHLVPLTEAIPAQAPPPSVWEGLVRRIPALAPARATTWWESLSLWRGLAITASAAVVALAGLDAYRASQPLPVAPPPVTVQAKIPALQVAGIASDKGDPVAMVIMQDEGDEVAFASMPSVSVPLDRQLQLWMANPKGEGVVSVGLIPRSAPGQAVRLSAVDVAALRSAKLLGLSIEPVGGSPQPTKVLGFGKWKQA